MNSVPIRESKPTRPIAPRWNPTKTACRTAGFPLPTGAAGAQYRVPAWVRRLELTRFGGHRVSEDHAARPSWST